MQTQTQINGTCWRERECSHWMQATSKEFEPKFACSCSVWIGLWTWETLKCMCCFSVFCFSICVRERVSKWDNFVLDKATGKHSESWLSSRALSIHFLVHNCPYFLNFRFRIFTAVNKRISAFTSHPHHDSWNLIKTASRPDPDTGGSRLIRIC